jgi:hypothetical protein
MIKFQGFQGLKIKDTKSESGDDCHKDILEVKDNDCKRFLKNYFSNNIFVCCNGQEVKLTREQSETLREFVKDCVETTLNGTIKVA